VALSVGHAAYVPAIAPYQAGDGAAARLLGRLRMVSGVVQATLPFVAGVAIAAAGRDLGFALSAVAYAAAAGVMLALPPLSPAIPPGRVQANERVAHLHHPGWQGQKLRRQGFDGYEEVGVDVE
jgi:hypothetical protein